MPLPSLFTAVSALRSHQQMLSTVANNLANVNTTGFKASRVIFEDSLSQTLEEPSAAIGGVTGGRNGIQIGLGSSISSVTPSFIQGSLQNTGLPMDLAIEGDGFFVVQDPATEQVFMTRAGAFNLSPTADDANVLNVTTPSGFLLQTDIEGESPIEIENDSDNAIVSISVAPSGDLSVLLEDGSIEELGQIALQRFNNPQALKKVGQSLFVSTPAAGPALDGTEPGGSAGLGTIRSGFLEMSNVDFGLEFTEMIRAQRGLQASSRTITTSDEVLQELINLKR